MIWPFKKKEPAIPFEEYAMTLPTPACGDNVVHYEWEQVNGMSCPKCEHNRKRREKNAELDALADKIVARLRAPDSGVQGAVAVDGYCRDCEDVRHCGTVKQCVLGRDVAPGVKGKME